MTATAAAASAKEWAAAFTGPSPIALPLRRVDLARLFAEWGFTKGAEIGVERGHYSETLCQANPELKLLCVDAWKAYRHYREHVSQDKLDGFYTAAVQRLKPYRCQIRRGWSVVEARRVPNHSLDFVYIDGNHKYWHVLCDIEAWAPKVRPGGVISGHDYGRASVGQVKEAVEHWTSTHAIGTWFVLAGDRSPSWFWVRA